MKNKIKYTTALFMILLASVFLSGCWDQKIYERIGFILQIGLEQDETGMLKYSITMPVVSEDIEEKIEVIAISTDLLRESREILRNLSGKRVEGGKIQHVIYSKELAQKGIGDTLDVFLRNPEIPLLVNVVVVDGSPYEMYEKSKSFKDKPRTAFYITQVIDDARRRTNTPDTRIFDFSILQKSETFDPVANYIRFNEKAIEVMGTALFNEDKMVGTLDIVNSGLMLILRGENPNLQYYYRGDISEDVRDDGKKGIAITINNAKRKIKSQINGNLPEIDISLELNATLDEYKSGQQLNKAEVQKKLEDDITKAIQQDYIELLSYFQEISADPVGFSEILRVKHNKYYKTIEFDKIYKDIKFNVDVKLNIAFYGAMS